MPSKPGIAGKLWYSTLTEHRAEADLPPRSERFSSWTIWVAVSIFMLCCLLKHTVKKLSLSGKTQCQQYEFWPVLYSLIVSEAMTVENCLSLQQCCTSARILLCCGFNWYCLLLTARSYTTLPTGALISYQWLTLHKWRFSIDRRQNLPQGWGICDPQATLRPLLDFIGVQYKSSIFSDFLYTPYFFF